MLNYYLCKTRPPKDIQLVSQAEVSDLTEMLAPGIMHPEDSPVQVSNETPNSLSSLTAVQQPTKIDMQMGRPKGTTEVEKTENNKQKKNLLLIMLLCNSKG